MDYLDTVFKLSVTPCLLLRADECFTIEKINQAYLRVIGTNEQELTGLPVFDVLPQGEEIYNGWRELKYSLLTVVHTRKPHQLPVQKIAVGKQTRYWEIENIPLLNTQGEVEYIMHSVKDITELVHMDIKKSEVEERYDDLFHLSPLPMWVYQVGTLKFLDVNDAALRQYGYSREEFLQMTIRDIRPANEKTKIEETVNQYGEYTHLYFSDTFRHKKKNGEIIRVDIYSSRILFHGKKAKMIIANDITNRLNHMDKIEKQNEALREIAWIQSHVVRAPLARIMGCVRLLNDHSNDCAERKKLLEYLHQSATDFDGVVKEVVEKAHLLHARYKPSQTFSPVGKGFKKAYPHPASSGKDLSRAI